MNYTDNDIQAIVDTQVKFKTRDLQSKIDRANEILEGTLVVKKENGVYKPIKNTTKQEAYEAIYKLYGVLETPYRNFDLLEEKHG